MTKPIKCSMNKPCFQNYGLSARKQQGGLALVLVLWMITLLMIMAASFSLTVSRETSVINGIKSKAQATSAAEAGITFAQMMLLNPDQNTRWHTDGSIYQIEFLDSVVRLRLLAESGKIDINKAEQKQLTSLFEQAPIPDEEKPAIVGAILDWRDPDDLININGAEKEEYNKANLKYQPRNKPFQTLDELQMVLGMNELILAWMEPMITLYSGSSNVDLSQASREVLLTIPGLDIDTIDQFIELRQQSAANGTPVPSFPLAGSPVKAAVGNDSAAVEIVSEVLLDDGSQTIIKVVIAKEPGNSNNPYKVLNWQRGGKNDISLFSEAMSQYLVTEHAES